MLLSTLLLFGLGVPLYAAAPTPSALINARAPEFSRVGIDHRKISLAEYRGKVVLLNFWATWCGPCLVEIPQFVVWQREYGGKGLQVVGVSMDDDAPPVHAAYQKYRLNYPVIMGDEKLGDLYGGILGLPVTFLIDRSGTVRFVYQGAADLDKLHSQIGLLLQQH